MGLANSSLVSVVYILATLQLAPRELRYVKDGAVDSSLSASFE